MSSAAFCFGSTIVYWDSVLIALGVLAGFLAMHACYAANRGRSPLLFLFAPLALLLGLLVSRTMYWYCHMEQFSGFASAFRDLSAGGFCLSGVVIGFVLSALLMRLLGLEKHPGRLLDCCAPGLALSLAVIRLSALFNGSCRGKALVTDPRLQRLPFAWSSLSSTGATEYRFAAFFVEALLFLAAFALLLWLYARWLPRGKKPVSAVSGDVFLFFLLFFGIFEMVIDSTRNDASYFHLNAFISVAQILSAVTILGILIVFSRRSIRLNGLRGFHWLLWALFLVSLAGGGFSEYLVQRHGNWQLRCYTLMSFACLFMLGSVVLMRRSCREAD